MLDNIKQNAIVGGTALVIGVVATYFLLPTKIETKVETKVEIKEVEKKVVVDRTIKRKIDKDGSVQEEITEKDRSTENSKEVDTQTVVSKVETNPKKARFAVKTLVDLNKEINPTNPNIGIGVQYDIMGNVFIEIGAFKEKQIEVGIGISL